MTLIREIVDRLEESFSADMNRGFASIGLRNTRYSDNGNIIGTIIDGDFSGKTLSLKFYKNKVYAEIEGENTKEMSINPGRFGLQDFLSNLKRFMIRGN